MPKPSPRPDLATLGFGDPLDEVLRGANPNPTRQGCPSRRVLVALARRERPIGDVAYDHLLHCSPCYVDVRELQREHVASRAEARRRWRLALVGLSAAALLVVAALGWWMRADRDAAGSPAQVQVTLDVRPYAVTRGQSTVAEPPALQFPRGVVEATILLPVGAEPGRYEVQLLDGRRTVVASGGGEATIRDFITTLEARLDTRTAIPSPHLFAIRRDGDGWRMYPAIVR